MCIVQIGLFICDNLHNSANLLLELKIYILGHLMDIVECSQTTREYSKDATAW